MSYPAHAVLTILDASLLLKDKAVLLDLGETLNDSTHTHRAHRAHTAYSLISKVVQGSYIEVMQAFDGSALSTEALLQLSSQPDAFEAIHDKVLEYIMGPQAGADTQAAQTEDRTQTEDRRDRSDRSDRSFRALESLVLAVAHLEVFCQYTHTRIHTYTHTHIHTYTLTHTYTHTHT
jgi:hypothetical protein